MKKNFFLISCFIIFSFVLISCSTNKSSTYQNVPIDLTKIVYEGGDGSSFENAIIIKNATTSRDGIAAEYAYIGKVHGERFKDWKTIMQSLSSSNGKHYDIIKINILSDNTTKEYYFDITSFFGKY